ALSAKENAALANYDQAFAQYRQVVLQAFQEVADTLHALEVDAHKLKAQVEAEEAASKALALIEKQFRLGAISYLSLLNAELQYQQARINRIEAKAMRYADTAALFQALGGGWWNRTDANEAKQAQNNNHRM
ncbi:MAG: TolC family protein, partial [Alphaproteobacteria bacterium]|nr:TolC family protein [Alphaproteobacteria bacterium]